MEITNVFKAYVKTVSTKRSVGQVILPKKKNKIANARSFNTKAQEVARNISKVKDFLLKYQMEYLCEYSHLGSLSSKLTEAERDQIESDAQLIITSCNNAISSLHNEACSLMDSQIKIHSLAVVNLVALYLNDICKLYSQQRAFRVQQAVEWKRLSRLSSKRIPDRQSKKVSSHEDEIVDRNEKSAVEQTTPRGDHPSDKEAHPEDECSITADEMQMFEEENKLLYSEMQSLNQEVKSIEGKVIEIGQLQEVFKEKVLTQAAQIESIHETAVTTTENVKEGNEQIRDAIKNSATFRVWILFFLVMCTFSLLFLDWYNY